MNEPSSITVTNIDIPFGKLVRFFLKCVVAAIPAIILFQVVTRLMMGALIYSSAILNQGTTRVEKTVDFLPKASNQR